MRDDIMIYDPRGIDNRRPRPAYGRPETVEINIGLRQYMLRVYNFMAAGLGISGLVAYLAVPSGFYQEIAGIPLIWIVMLAPLGAVLFRSFRIERISAGAALVTFRGFAVLMGLSLARIFLVFTGVKHRAGVLHQRRRLCGDEPVWFRYGPRLGSCFSTRFKAGARPSPFSASGGCAPPRRSVVSVTRSRRFGTISATLKAPWSQQGLSQRCAPSTPELKCPSKPNGAARKLKWLSGGLVVGAFAVLLVLERRRPLRRSVEPQWRRDLRNIGVAGASALAIRLAEAPFVEPLARVVERRGWGLLNQLLLPKWAQLPLALMLMDYTLFLWHILTHRVPFLWRSNVVRDNGCGPNCHDGAALPFCRDAAVRALAGRTGVAARRPAVHIVTMAKGDAR